MHVNVPSNVHIQKAVHTRCKFKILLRGMPISNKNLVPWWSNWRPKAHVTSQARTPNITNQFITVILNATLRYRQRWYHMSSRTPNITNLFITVFWMQHFAIGNAGITCVTHVIIGMFCHSVTTQHSQVSTFSYRKVLVKFKRQGRLVWQNVVWNISETVLLLSIPVV